MRRLCLLFTALLLAGAVPAHAQRPPAAQPAVVAVVDMQQLLSESAAGRSLRDQVNQLRRAGQADVAAREQGVRRQQEELTRQRATLTPAAFAEHRERFDRSVAELNNYARRRRLQVDRALQGGLKQIETTGTDILSQIARERGITLVLARRPTVHLSAKVLDVTTQVRERLDRRLTQVAVSLPPLSD